MAMKIIKKEDMIRKNSVARTKAEVALYKYFEKSHSKIQDTFNATFKDIIVRFYGSFKTRTHLCMVLEYCKYGDLRGLLNIAFGFGEKWSRQLIAEIIVGLQLMHSYGLVYNDLKPENLLLTNEGHVKFTDFGISRIAIRRYLKNKQGSLRLSLD